MSGSLDPRRWQGHVGVLEPDEEVWQRQLIEQSSLGWRLIGRTPQGRLIAEAILGCGRDIAHERRCTITRTPEGLVHRCETRPVGGAQERPAD